MLNFVLHKRHGSQLIALSLLIVLKSAFKQIAIFLIESNLYIALSASVLTFATQLLLHQQPGFHPYLFIIFFATFFDYNLHRLYTLHFAKAALQGQRHAWLLRNKGLFYMLMALASVGFLISISQAKSEVLLVLMPFAALTIFYSIPFLRWKNKNWRLRDLPYIKLFLIAGNWTMITILLPLIQYGKTVDDTEVLWIIAERFFFVLALCIPFDIRDIDTDRQAGLSTIPNTIGVKKSWQVAFLCVIISAIISTIHYLNNEQISYLIAFLISATLTIIALSIAKRRLYNLYLYGVIDGMMLLQAILVIMATYF